MPRASTTASGARRTNRPDLAGAPKLSRAGCATSRGSTPTTGSASSSWWRVARSCSSSCSRTCCCATRPPTVATWVRTCGGRRTCATTCCRSTSRAGARTSMRGSPPGQYYFPVPALSIVGLDLFIPYNVAFKLVVALGPVLVPIGAYVLAKGLRAPNPTPAAMAVAITSFLFFTGDPGSSTAAAGDCVQPTHHGRHPREHPRRRVLVHHRDCVRTVVHGNARMGAAHPRAPLAAGDRCSRCA